MEHAMEGGGPAGQGSGVGGSAIAGVIVAAPMGDAGCRALLAACADDAERASASRLGDAELERTLAELALLCRTAERAMELGARTTRELRLICAAICHLCAEQCSARAEPWARRLARQCRDCADACRAVMDLTGRNAA